MSSSDFCVIQLQGWSTWWQETRSFRPKVYISIVLFFLSAALAYPIARSVFFVLRRATPKRYVWPDEARVLAMWQTALLCRAGLFWIALRVSRLSMFLCQWPSWLFGVCFIIWMDAGGNVLREVIVRKGTKGYAEDEKAGRITLLYEGTTLAKMLLLIMVVYTLYISAFVEDEKYLRAVSSAGFFLAIALSLLPLLRNVLGAHYMFLNNMMKLTSRVRLEGGVHGTVSDAPLGFLVVETADKSKTFVPAGGSVTTATTLYNDLVHVLCLDIRLPPETAPRNVRAFVQELDRLAVSNQWSSGLSSQRSQSRIDPASLRVGPTSKLLLDWDWQEQQEMLDRARAHQHTVELSTSERWVVHVKTFLRAKNQQTMEELRSSLIEDIMKLKERWLGLEAWK